MQHNENDNWWQDKKTDGSPSKASVVDLAWLRDGEGQGGEMYRETRTTWLHKGGRTEGSETG